MQFSRNRLYGRSKYLVAALLLLFTAAIFAAFGMADGDDFAIARREILLRRIGHELLLQSGDSTSRVLPVKKVADNEYRISFEKELTFLSDSLVNTTQRLLARDPLTGDYVVNVLNGPNAGVAYGYAISKNKKNDIIACIGRKQPAARYVIEVKFKPAGIITKNKYLLGGLPFLAFIGFILYRPVKARQASSQNTGNELLTFGSMVFDAKNRKLVINGIETDLTGTESRLLRIFASSPNQTIERSRLQKEIWEDEGVIVGRSLDMFISKLRKKLEADPGINIVVIRGKGYRLEVRPIVN